MGGSQAKPSGPDLGEGIDEARVPDGGMVLGHVGDDAVIVARQGDALFAVGATCTHYGGPLGEGLVVGDTVRCPWHHACFSLRTGAAVGAPALDAVACYEVERAEGKVRVRGKKEPGRGRPGDNAPVGAGTKADADVRRVVIVGAGAAGGAAAEMLRREGFDGSVTLLGADPSVPVDRPNLSKDYLAGNAPEEWIPLRSKDFYDEHSIDAEFETPVQRIDTKGRNVLLEGRREVPYDRLVLATGAEARRLDAPGFDRPEVHTLRTLADCHAILSRLDGASRAVVVGASFIGLEVAASLRARGLEVAVVAPETRPLERVLGPALGDMVRAIHEEHGVRFHLGQVPVRFDGGKVVLKDGTELPADLVVVGVGVTPATRLAEAAGLVVDRGVVVDAKLRTSDPHVYAAGDAARYPDPRSGERVRIEHWVVAQRQGQTAARNALGQGVAFTDVPFFWSAHYDTTIGYVGHAEEWDRIDVDGDPASRDCAVAFRRDGRTLAVAVVGRDRVGLEAEAAMERDDEAALGKLVPAS